MIDYPDRAAFRRWVWCRVNPKQMHVLIASIHSSGRDKRNIWRGNFTRNAALMTGQDDVIGIASGLPPNFVPLFIDSLSIITYP